jgi:hypothetical protein
MASNVRFGSKADICAAIRHVRFTPDNDRESGFSQTVMSALPLKADMCGATTDVRFGPQADMVPYHPHGPAEISSDAAARRAIVEVKRGAWLIWAC